MVTKTETKVKHDVQSKVAEKTASFYKTYADSAKGIRTSKAQLATSAAELGVAIDAHGYEYLPLMEARPNATFKTWWKGTNACPEKGYIHVFGDLKGKKLADLEKQWDHTNDFIDALRIDHTASELADSDGKGSHQFRHIMLRIKQNCMYWQGNARDFRAEAKTRAGKRKIAAKFEKAVDENGYLKKRTGSGTDSGTYKSIGIASIDQYIKSAVDGLELMRTAAISRKGEEHTLWAGHFGSLLANLELVQALRKSFTPVK
jgi:hypothetical protein